MAGSKGKVCLAYSGGLDTSTILAWLLEQQYEVVKKTGLPLRKKVNKFSHEVRFRVPIENTSADILRAALQIGATKMIIDDLRKVFVDELCWKAVQCNAIYEDQYLLGTSLARPVIARGMMKAAEKEGCDFVSHGCTGKGNDQVRFELAYLTINPAIKVIAPWRDPLFYQRFQGRNDLLDYAAEKGIPVTSTKAKPYSMDDNLAHCSYEAGMLEDPNVTPPEDMWTRTVSPLKAPDTPLDITVHFDKGLPIKVVTTQETVTESLELFNLLNALDDSPAMTILRLAHISIEGLVLDGRVRSLRDNLSKQWSELLYNGLYFSPERAFLQPSLDFSQQRVNGEVRLRLYKGNAYVLGRTSQEKLYSEEDASMDSLTTFDPSETSGFITINAIRLKKYGLQLAEAGIEL
ncbi:hypothetical protein C2857_004258 [Epichloe festucae Fl1]|uniref:argininosuccinate synthase n=1 Tax=Epichloe festucae (strain Fl1) TaxID=877507 RepID=A0A7S9KKK4_EPIFF|nr:hypothetical protein C2857_004258 [Epichloe festucae Fl1]